MKIKSATKIIAWWFVILFLYTGVSKLMEYSVFKEEISMTVPLGPLVWWIAWLVPFSEFIAAILLFIPKWRQKGFWLALGLMVAFTVYVAALIVYNNQLPCSCGGIIELLSWKGHLIFNNICIGLAITGILLGRSYRRNEIITTAL